MDTLYFYFGGLITAEMSFPLIKYVPTLNSDNTSYWNVQELLKKDKEFKIDMTNWWIVCNSSTYDIKVECIY